MAKDVSKEPAKALPLDATPDIAALQARANELRRDIDALFDRQTAQLKSECPGVPEAVLRGLLMKGQGCRCAVLQSLAEAQGVG